MSHAKRYNAIWIFSDQQPAHLLSCNDSPNLNTPNLDRLAASGLNCRRAVSGSPLCCPFRGSLLTGLYPHRCVPGHEYPLDPATPTIAHVFREHGYHTGYIGKWHLDGYHERDGRAALHVIPPERRGGFDSWIGYENNNSQYDCRVHGGPGYENSVRRLPGYETDALTDLFIDYLDERGRHPEQNFFAVLSVQPPHDPYIAPPEYMARHQPRELRMRPNVPEIPGLTDQARRDLAGACAMVENLDWNVGRIVRALDAAGLLETTHILFFSDHGDMHGSHGQFRKTSPWEESVRIPCIIGGAGEYYNFRRGVSDAVINHVDFAPTTLGLCGLPVPDAMAGFDYSALRRFDRDAGELPESAFLQLVVPTMHHDSLDSAWRAVVTRDGWKYAALPGQHLMLHDLNTDPYELVNLAHNSRFHAQRRRLRAMLGDWIERTGDRFPLPED